MPEERAASDRLAILVADGGPIDWDDALRSASDDVERRVIRQLRLVESVARFHRSAASPAAMAEASSTMTDTADGSRRRDLAPEEANWGPLELREELGHGAFGEVYLAWDPRLDREVALKILRVEESAASALATTIVKEGRLLAKLRHPNVVTVYGAEIHDGRVGLWMELIRGRSLEQLLRDQGPFGAREAMLIGLDLCRALAAVHGAGVVHRDVKAQNVMREEGGRILLTDFGAGVEVSAETAAGKRTISGTPLYMAPEIVRGEPATRRSDIYSLGVLLYRMVSGTFPVEAGSWEELRDKHARREATLLRDRRADLPEGFIAVVERALAWNPDDRFTTAGQMEQALSLALGAAGGAAPEINGTKAGTRRGFSLRMRWGSLRIYLSAALAVAGVAVLGSLWVSERNGVSLDRRPVPQPPLQEGLAASASYTVEASFFRIHAKSTVRERLDPGARLALGDNLTLEFKASAPLHVYVIDEDDVGHAYALFPLSGLDLANPLPPDSTHVLPGTRAGKNLSWTVDSQGGREHLLVLASPTRLVDFETEMNALARPGQTAVPIPDSAKVHLRGIGGLAETPATGRHPSAGPLFEMAEQLASRSESVQGVWLRRIELENPHSR